MVMPLFHFEVMCTMYSVYNELTRMVSSRMPTKLILTQVDSHVYDIKFTFCIYIKL